MEISTICFFFFAAHPLEFALIFALYLKPAKSQQHYTAICRAQGCANVPATLSTLLLVGAAPDLHLKLEFLPLDLEQKRARFSNRDQS